MTETEALSLFEKTGALLSGHFVLTSGRHSDRYFEKFHVLRYPEYVEQLGRALAAQCGLPRVRRQALKTKLSAAHRAWASGTSQTFF
jgi:orotate phosphoribosyltransferase